jgi:rhamnosyltransferase
VAGKVAIVAHFDPDNRIEPPVVDMLKCLERVFDRVLLVSTSAVDASALTSLNKTETIERPNIGYDFYSYRVGLDRVWHGGGADQALLLNTSIVVLDPDKFTDALRLMSGLVQEHDAISATLSRQFAEHLQSYMMLLSGRVLAAPWFQAFVNGIEPLGDKMEIVRRYELGLTGALKENGADITSLFTPTVEDAKAAKTAWLAWRKANSNTWQGLRAGSGSAADQYNPVQFHGEVARAFGFIKAEIPRDNPHGIDLSFVREIASPETLAGVDRLVERMRDRYRPARKGQLATIATATTTDPEHEWQAGERHMHPASDWPCWCMPIFRMCWKRLWPSWQTLLSLSTFT